MTSFRSTNDSSLGQRMILVMKSTNDLHQWWLVPMGCRAAAPPTRFCDLFFRIFYNVNIFYNITVHTLFTNAPVCVAQKTNFPILLALTK